MNFIEERHNHAVGKEEDGGVTTTPSAPAPTPAQFAVRDRKNPPQSLGQNRVALIGAAAIILAAIVFLITAKPTHKPPKTTKPSSTQDTMTQTQDKAVEKSLFPVTDSAPELTKATRDDTVAEEDVHRTATHPPVPQPKNTGLPKGATLGALPPFDTQQGPWQAPPYRPGVSSDELQHESPKMPREADESSLVFVRKTMQSASSPATFRADAEPSGVPLAAGSRLRAKLETAISTAVKMPVIAVIEYNYENEGEIVVPAGSKCFGHIEQADRSGNMDIRFDTLIEPDGSSTRLDAVATDLSLKPLKGRVDGKNGGKNVIVKSLAGLGEVGALIAGRGTSFNQPISEGDLLRERVSNNIGTSTDQQLTRLATSEHLVVSVPASTSIYVVLDHVSRQSAASQDYRRTATSTSSQIQSLKELLQLQRELNASVQATR